MFVKPLLLAPNDEDYSVKPPLDAIFGMNI